MPSLSISLRATLAAMIAAMVAPLAVLLSLAWWYVDPGLPEQEAFAPVQRALEVALAFASLVALGAVALASFVARRLSRPVAGDRGGDAARRVRRDRPRRARERPARDRAHRRRVQPHDRGARAARGRAAGGARAGRGPRAAPRQDHRDDRRGRPDPRTGRPLRARQPRRGGAARRAPRRDHRRALRRGALGPRRRSTGPRSTLADHPFERLRRGEPTVHDQVFQIVRPRGRARMVSVNAAASATRPAASTAS